MLDSLLIMGSILFFIVLTYAYKMIQRKYNNYPTACNVLYIPKKEKMNIIDPKMYQSSPLSFKIDPFKISDYPNETILDKIN